jgi:hypothetical protein
MGAGSFSLSAVGVSAVNSDVLIARETENASALHSIPSALLGVLCVRHFPVSTRGICAAREDFD